MKYVRLKDLKLEYVSPILVIISGIFCIIFKEHLVYLLPLIFGCLLFVIGIILFIEGIIYKEYANLEKTHLEKSFAIMTLGICILLKQNNALFLIGTFWGLYGFVNSSNHFNIAFYNFHKKNNWAIPLLEGLIEFILASILIFDPFSHLGHHIFILGLELVFDGSLDLFDEYNQQLSRKK